MMKVQMMLMTLAMMLGLVMVGCGEDDYTKKPGGGGDGTVEVKTSSAEDALKTLSEAFLAGDTKALNQVLDTTKDANKKVAEWVDLSKEATSTWDSLSTKITEKYGEAAAKEISLTQQFTGASMDFLKKTDLVMAEDGNSAKVTYERAGKQEELAMVKLDGTWKADFSGAKGLSTEFLDKQIPELKKFKDLFETMLKDVGQYDTYEAFKEAQKKNLIDGVKNSIPGLGG